LGCHVDDRTGARFTCCAQKERIRQRLPRGFQAVFRLGMSRRDQITLSEEELRELLEGERIAVVSSLGPRGWPHSMPLWFVPREGEVWIWTYAKSQKVRNLSATRGRRCWSRPAASTASCAGR